MTTVPPKISSSTRPNSQNQISFAEDFDEISSLSLKNKIFGFIICILLGTFFSALAYSAISIGNTKMFTVFYGLTNLIFLSGTAIIVGPARQCQLMFTTERIMSSLIYLAATVAVILTAIRGKMILATILFVVQILSLIWYTISYIPYAQQLLSRMFGI